MINGTAPFVEAKPGPNSDQFQGLYKGDTGFHVADIVDADLSHKVSKETARLSWPDRDDASINRMELHWVITTCNRQLWMRHLSSTILNGLMMGVRPTTLTVLMCDHLNEAQLPTFVYNLRYSRHIRFIFLPADIQRSYFTNYLMAMSVPYYYGMPNLPVLVTEDDLVFQPDFNRKLFEVTKRIHEKRGTKEPYLLNLYNGNADDFTRWTSQQVVDNYRKGVRNTGAAQFQHAMHFDIHSGSGAFGWGTQALVFSPGMVRLQLQQFIQVVYQQHQIRYSEPHMDLVIRDMLDRFNCFPENQNKCMTHLATPSLVEHMGVVSSMFGGFTARSKFHMSKDFPFKVEFPGLDGLEEWRRKKKRSRRAKL